MTQTPTDGAVDRRSPDVLLIMTDQQRFDTIRCLGNSAIDTPALDRLVARGVVFDNGYSTCPVCVPARYTLQSGCEPTRTDVWDNQMTPRGHDGIAAANGPFLPAAMADRGYRTFGIGKFHTMPWDASLGFEVQLHSEELYDTPEQRAGDAYAHWIATEHPEYDWIEALMGERTEMYYMPQLSPLPAALTVEGWAADRAVEQISLGVRTGDRRPFYGQVSFIGPHPPFAPPLPYNRRYDPDEMALPVSGSLEVDHLDQHIPWMNHLVFAEDVGDGRARALKARYYGEISYIDDCLGRILDAVDHLPDPDNVLIMFVSDHGDLLGDHHGWQKESFFEASTRIPYLVSWPASIRPGERSSDLVCLTDLFGIATGAAGRPELRQGHDVLAGLVDDAPGRDHLIGYHGRPGTDRFKAMVRRGQWKLIWHANGGESLLFDLAADPHELTPLQGEHPGVVDELYRLLLDDLRREGATEAFDGDELRVHPYRVWERRRILQLDRSRGVTGYGQPVGDPAS